MTIEISRPEHLETDVQPPKQNFADFLLSSPLAHSDLVIERAQDHPLPLQPVNGLCQETNLEMLKLLKHIRRWVLVAALCLSVYSSKRLC